MSATAFAALREAWIDMPFEGIVPKGWGDCVANLLNAVTDLVDPERTLREEPEVKRRGSIAGYRNRWHYANEQVQIAEASGFDAAEWIAKRDAEATACLGEHGIVLP